MRIRKKFLFYALALSSALITALGSGIDTTISRWFITNAWDYGIACFLVGVIIALVFTLLFSVPFKGKSLGARVMDPSFTRLRMIRKEEVKYQILAAFGNAVTTLGYFALLIIILDPSVVMPFSQMVILYLVLAEAITEKNIPTLTEIQSSLIVTFGAILGSISLSGALNLTSLALVFLLINPGWMIYSVYQRKLKLLKIDERPNDSLNIRFWNVLFSFLITVAIVGIFDMLSGSHHVQAGITASFTYFNWVALMAIATFFALVLYIRALGFGKASVTQAVKSTTIIFSIPVSLLLAGLGIIQPFSTDPVLLLIKFIGMILMILGIASFALTQIKAYVFIKVKPGYSIEETMKKFWDIRGVTRVTATAGPYDFVIKIQMRTLLKGYEGVVRKLEGIEAIKKYKWESVLKEWEHI
jgi:DNA-binding Lrp family transcriptional regulator